ncbi:DUF3422 family protein [Aestuariibius sp. HNIBRBA575]|uniref:DUF3422 family protein n=1 Tax=Aestuariibius sp. HNIBRBA575 TaxID=3233343 RepID=UPI0034A26138
MNSNNDHPKRYAMANELHARPFPLIAAPGRAAYLAIKPARNAAGRDRDADRAHLIALLDRFGAPHPQPNATHYSGQIGRHILKWESHTEFVTYTIHCDGVADDPFNAATFKLFPEEWLAQAPGVRVTSALIRIEQLTDDTGIPEKTRAWFVPESLAMSRVLDDDLVVGADFRIDEAGHMRFAVFVRPECGARRVGRVVQRLCEIETYKAMAMLGYFQAGELNTKMGAIDARLSKLMEEISGTAPEVTLSALIDVSAELENLSAKSSFRFGATGAYETIVNQRVAVLREQRFKGRQTFGEFMMRRFDPAMRTVASTQDRLQVMADRARRAGELLRTRVDVERSAQNQALLESMDKRADLQLRLQQTVEGLSVVAISYYAVSLGAYALYPLGKWAGISKELITAGLVVPVLVLVWLMVRAIRNKFH